MIKLWLVAWHEYRQHVLKRSFLFALLSVPLLIAVLALVAKVPSLLDSMNTRYTAVGYVDHAGVLAGNVPVSTGSSEQTVQLIAFSTEEAATAALEAEEIEAYYVLGADYHQTRQVELVYIDEPGGDAVRQFREFLRVNLLADQPVEIAQRALEGSHHTVRSPDGRREFSGSLTLGQLLPALTGLALVALIFFSSGYLMQAVVEEKSNRTMEILVTSISSNQLVGGKVLGIIAVSVTQFLGWIVFAILAAIVGGQFLGVEWLQDLGVDPQAVLMMIALVVPAYVMAAALMTAIGAAFTEEQVGQQIVALFISFYMIPLGLIIPLMRTPNSSLAVGLSLFPLTAPVILPLRTLFTPVPLWQTAAAVAIQSLLALGRVDRSTHLPSGHAALRQATAVAGAARYGKTTIPGAAAPCRPSDGHAGG